MRPWIVVFFLLMLAACTQDSPVYPDEAQFDFQEATDSQEVPDFFLDLGVEPPYQDANSTPVHIPEGQAAPAPICSGVVCSFGSLIQEAISLSEDVAWDVFEDSEPEPDADSDPDSDPALGFYGDPCTEDTHCRSDICGFGNTCVDCHSLNGCDSDQVCIQGQCEYPLVFGEELTVQASYADPHEGSTVDIHLVNVDRVPEGLDPRDAFNTQADCFLEGCFLTTDRETSQEVRVIDYAPARFLVGVHYQGPFGNHLDVFLRLRGRPGLTRSFDMPVNTDSFICLGVVDTLEATWTSCGDEGPISID
jgi:hypothetical protein